ncbi:hypothetical protein JOQ06_026898, partial [Pogonophryne albipinna]
ETAVPLSHCVVTGGAAVAAVATEQDGKNFMDFLTVQRPTDEAAHRDKSRYARWP